MADTDWQIATQTHCGNVRKNNEDSLLALQSYPLFVVADGMGGHEAGEVASQMLVDSLAKLNLHESLKQAVDQVENSITAVNTEVRRYAEQNLKGKTMGTTVVAMLAEGLNGACIWAGDSRLYRLRDDDIDQISEDHSFVTEMVKSGQLTPEEAANHPSSNVITRAVGAAPQLALEVTTFDIKPNDTYLLCSDGLYNEVEDHELEYALGAGDVVQSSERLLQLCLSRTAKDNVSFIIGRVLDKHSAQQDATLTYFPD